MGNHGTLRTQAIHYIQQCIADGTYQPGDRIVESRIAHELNMSQAPVREAILELSAIGILTRKPYSGSFVRGFGKKELEDYYTTRAYLEKYAAQLAAEKITPELLKKMRYCIFEMEECTDKDTFTDIDLQFHEYILDASDNVALKQAWLSLNSLQQTALSTLITSLSVEELTEQHRELYRHIESGDGEAASAAIYLHIKTFGEEVIQNLNPYLTKK